MANKCRYPEEDMERSGNDPVIRTGYFPFECIENERDDSYPARFYKRADEPDGSRYFFDLSYKSWFGGERISPEA
jgi:hypothetical protein